MAAPRRGGVVRAEMKNRLVVGWVTPLPPPGRSLTPPPSHLRVGEGEGTPKPPWQFAKKKSTDTDAAEERSGAPLEDCQVVVGGWVGIPTHPQQDAPGPFPDHPGGPHQQDSRVTPTPPRCVVPMRAAAGETRGRRTAGGPSARVVRASRGSGAVGFGRAALVGPPGSSTGSLQGGPSRTGGLPFFPVEYCPLRTAPSPKGRPRAKLVPNGG